MPAPKVAIGDDVWCIENVSDGVDIVKKGTEGKVTEINSQTYKVKFENVKITNRKDKKSRIALLFEVEDIKTKFEQVFEETSDDEAEGLEGREMDGARCSVDTKQHEPEGRDMEGMKDRQHGGRDMEGMKDVKVKCREDVYGDGFKVEAGKEGQIIGISPETYTVKFENVEVSDIDGQNSCSLASAVEVEESKSKFEPVYPEGRDVEGARKRNEGYPEGHDMEWAIAMTKMSESQPYKLYREAYNHFSIGNTSPFKHTKPKYQAMVDLAEDDMKKGITRFKRAPYIKRPREEGGDESHKKSRTESALSVRSTQSTLAVPGKKPTSSAVALLTRRVKATKEEEKLKQKELKKAEASLKKLRKNQAKYKTSWDEAKANVTILEKPKKKTEAEKADLKDEMKKAKRSEKKHVRCTPHIKRAEKKITQLKSELTKIKAKKNNEKNDVRMQEEQDKLNAEAERELKAKQDSNKAHSDSDSGSDSESNSESNSDSDTVCNSDSNSEDAVAEFYKKMSGGTTEKEVTQSRFTDVALSDAEIAKHFGLQIQEGCTRQALQMEADKNPADNTLLKITTIFDDINKGSSSSQSGKSFTFGDFKISKYAEGL